MALCTSPISYVIYSHHRGTNFREGQGRLNWMDWVKGLDWIGLGYGMVDTLDGDWIWEWGGEEKRRRRRDGEGDILLEICLGVYLYIR